MQVISRHCIHQDIVLYQHDCDQTPTNQFDYTALCDMIDYWKCMLYSNYGARPGHSIFLDFTTLNVYYYTAFFAACELGLILVIDMPHAYCEEDLQDDKINIHGKIDFVISESKRYTPGHVEYNYWDEQRNRQIGRELILQDAFDTNVLPDNTVYQQVAKKLFCTPDQDLMWSHSSGTTGKPTRIVNSHKKIYLMSKRMVTHLGFTSNQRVLHIRNVHHGASMCYYFLPSFMACQSHFSLAFDSVERIPDLIRFTENNQINRMFLYKLDYLNEYLAQVPAVERPVEICALFINKDTLYLMKQKNIVNVQALFGDTTIGIGMFVKTLDQSQTVDSYDPSDFGPALDDFFQYTIDEDRRLWVACAELGEDFRTSNDTFELQDQRYYFRGRMNNHRINHEWIDLIELEERVRDLFGPLGATIVLDKDYQKIYLAIWRPDPTAEQMLADHFARRYLDAKINYVVRDQAYDHFFSSRKIDQNKLRNHCRSRIMLNESTKA